MPNVEPLREGDPAAVGPYRLAGRLGAGGHGVVYLGRAHTGTPVAVKVLHEGLAAGDRLAADIAAASRVEPYCLARVLDASTGGRPYIVSEYVDGPSLQQEGPLGGPELRELAVGTATALDAIHRAGVVHGDLTPSNVLLGPDGPRVVDFGLAGALGSGMKATSSIVGTPAYMAPERLSGKAAEAPADVFSWASVLVFAATGVPPFGDDALPAVIHRILHEEPRLGDLPRALREVVAACLAKDPAARPGMREVLRRVSAPPPRPAPPSAFDWEHTPDRAWDPPAPADPTRAAEETSVLSAEHTPAPSAGQPTNPVQITEPPITAEPVPTVGPTAESAPTTGPTTGPAHPGVRGPAAPAGVLGAATAERPLPHRSSASAAEAGLPRRTSTRTTPGNGPRTAAALGPHTGSAPHTGAAPYTGAEPVFPPLDDPPWPHTGAAVHNAAHNGEEETASTLQALFDLSSAVEAPGAGSGRPDGPPPHRSAARTPEPPEFSAPPGFADPVMSGVEHSTAPAASVGSPAGAGARDVPAPGWRDDGHGTAVEHDADVSARPAGGSPRNGAVSGDDGVHGGDGPSYRDGLYHDGAYHEGGLSGGDGPPQGGDVDGRAEGGAGNRGEGRGRRVKTALVAVLAGLCVVALGGAILWLTPTTPTSMTAKLAVVTDAPTAPPGTTPPRTGTRTAPPSPRTDGRPSAVSTDATGGDTPAGALGGFAIAQVRPAGTRDGVCWSGGEVTLRALVRRTGEATSFDYTWVIDGADVARSSAVIGENGRRLLAAPRPLRSTGGAHSVTLRITSPVALQRTVTVTMCEQAAY